MTLSINSGGDGTFPDDPTTGFIVLRYPVRKYVVKVLAQGDQRQVHHR
ncbi:MAG: hypothetical protein HND48_20315 [Chloroflexi bacterium]|nr:hypothetical protein [Chloroflexota bacterium]